MQAVGDGAQGWANAVLYIFFSPMMRQRLFSYPCSQCWNAVVEKARELLETDHEYGPNSEHSRRTEGLVQKTDPINVVAETGKTTTGRAYGGISSSSTKTFISSVHSGRLTKTQQARLNTSPTA